MPRIRRYFYAISAVMAFTLALNAAFPAGDIRFVNISRNEGLSRNAVMCILQDRSGFMWFGTELGLNRFDGNDFKVFLQIPGDPVSLSHGYILSLHEDRAGILWIGTFNGGLNRYDPATGAFRCYRHDPGRADSLSHDIVGAIHEDRAGALWIGTDNGINRLDRATGRFTRYPLAGDRPGSSNHVHDICEDRDGKLWIGTFGGGIYRLERETGKYVHYRHDAANAASLSNDFIYSILEDRQGTLWVGTEKGLNCFDRGSGSFSRCRSLTPEAGVHLHDAIHVICEDRNGFLWIGTKQGLVCLENRGGNENASRPAIFDAKLLERNQIYAIHEDRSGIIWIGTGETGIHKYDPRQKKFSHYRSLPADRDSLGGNSAYSFWEDPGRALWIGTENGLDRFDRAGNTFVHFSSVPDAAGRRNFNNIRSIHGDRAGTLWLGTDGDGLERLDPASGKVTQYRNEPGNPRSLSYDRIRAICEDRAGALWIGTLGGGLNRLNRDSGTFTRYQFNEKDPASLSDNVVRALMEDRSGTLWIGTYGGGLNRFDRQAGTFTRFRHDPADPFSLSNDFVFCIHEDRAGDVWIGTWGGGLNRLDRGKGSFRHFTMVDGLASNAILGILEDKSGNLWLSTSEGLSRFTPSTGQVRNFDASDGLQGREFLGGAAYQNAGGEMFFGGTNGFNAFFPQNIYDNWYVPPVRITSFKVLNKEVQLAKPVWETAEIVLSPRDYLFSLEFAALDYSAPEKNKYAYKLEGLTADWIETDARRRLASFSLLPPGRYVFRVKGSNSDGLWNDQDVSLVIRMRGPWWRSWWFLALLATFVALAAGQWSRTRIRRQARRARTEAARDQVFAKVNISPREKEIIELLLQGRSNKEIAAELFIEISTVKIHVHHVFRKLAVRNRAQLLRLFQNLKT